MAKPSPIVSNEQRAYDEANAAYRTAWLSETKLKRELRKKERAFLGLPMLVSLTQIEGSPDRERILRTIVEYQNARQAWEQMQDIASRLLTQREQAYQDLASNHYNHSISQ